MNPQDVLEQVEWTTLAFFIGLFMLVGGLEETGWTVEIREWLVDLSGGNERNLAFLLVWFGGMTSAIVDNIPFTATMVEVVGGFSEDGSEGISPLWWALAMGADLGGNATIVGASANVIVVSLARAGGLPHKLLAVPEVRRGHQRSDSNGLHRDTCGFVTTHSSSSRRTSGESPRKRAKPIDQSMSA